MLFIISFISLGNPTSYKSLVCTYVYFVCCIILSEIFFCRESYPIKWVIPLEILTNLKIKLWKYTPHEMLVSQGKKLSLLCINIIVIIYLTIYHRIHDIYHVCGCICMFGPMQGFLHCNANNPRIIYTHMQYHDSK